MSRRGNFVTEGKFSLKYNFSNTFAYMYKWFHGYYFISWVTNIIIER